jgi:hypothetical protein
LNSLQKAKQVQCHPTVSVTSERKTLSALTVGYGVTKNDV